MDANTQPARRARREVHTDDLQMQQPPSIVLPETGNVLAHEPEAIEVLDKPIGNDYAAELAFNEEVMTIRLEASADKFTPKWLDFYVNGMPVWIPVGVPFKVKRKYVEIIARAKPISITTESGEVDGDELTKNVVHRYSSSKYPFSVIHDPSGAKGTDWLTRIYAER